MVDLLVLGAGMAGCAAATRAAREGASVVLAEKTAAIGGSAVYAGYVWSAPTLEVMRRENPDADVALSRRLVDDYDAAVDWLRSLGVEMGRPVAVLGFGRGRAVDTASLLLACRRSMRETEGCELVLGTSTERLLVEEGRVCGAVLRGADGALREVRARTTLLATGGFGGDAELRAQLIHPRARDLTLRANRGSSGD